MIKLKATFGNDIKCKIDPEMVVLKHELNILQVHAIQELLKVQCDKTAELTYSGDTRKNLAQKISQGLSEGEIIYILESVAKTILDLAKMELNTQRLLLNPEWMFLNEEKKEVYLVYIPINGMELTFDYALFAFELVYNAQLSFDSRKKLNQWISVVKKTGINALSILQLKRLLSDEKLPLTEWEDNGVKHELDDEDEAPTGMDDDYYNVSPEVDAEAPTGYDDEDPKTEDDDLYYGTVFDKSDGTFLHETISERGYGMSKPYIYRRATGEKVFIDKSEFRIGRSISRAHLCITNNNSVSNVHATIFTNNGQDYFIKDNNSTNGTSVNGIKVIPGGNPEKLYDGSIIVLFNEELEFHF